MRTYARIFIVSLTLLVASCAIKSAETFTTDGAWCWFQDPRAVYVEGEHERTYAQWVTRKGQLKVGAYDHDTHEIETFTLKEDWDADDHNVGAFIVLPDNRLMVFYARHNKEGIFTRTAKNPEDIQHWNDEIQVDDSDHITYAHPVYLADEEKYYLFWRGPSWKPTFATSSDGVHWSEPRILLQGIDRESADIRPYLKVSSDGVSGIHFTFTDGHPRVEPLNSVYYMKYENGEFRKADGSVITSIDKLPVRPRQSDIVYNAKETGVRAWVWDIATDKRGFPVIAYTRLPAENDHRYHYARWSGDQWHDRELTEAGKWFPQTEPGTTEPEPHYSGGIVLNHGNPSVVYLSREDEDVFHIERWETPDQGQTWSTRRLTKGAEENSVRPVVPRGLPESDSIVLWMHGDYRHYTDFHTGIKILEN